MKRTASVLTLLLICTLTFGQSAKNVLDKAAAKVSNAKGTTASFTMSGSMGNTSGTIAFKGRKFHAVTPTATIWFNGKTMWTYMKNNDEVNVTTPSEAQLQNINPYNFIYLYKQGYDLSLDKSGKTHVVHLTSKKGGKLNEIYVTINKTTYQPTLIKMRYNGKWTTFSITNLKPKTLTDGTFVFNAKDFPQAEVIDLR
jgi:outer membrane lipoprotein-sorting protein